MKKIVSVFLSVSMVFCCFAFAGCSDTDSGTGSKKAWSIFLYICGTDLESDDGAATADIDEILGADFGNNVNVIIETGGTKTWQTEGIDSEKLQRFEVKDGVLNEVQSLESASMGEASTLGDYLEWGVKTYPAEKYMTVMWNHGGGSISGVEFDELYENDSLSLTELAQGIKQAGTKFEVLGFDTCLMSTLENATSIADYGNYMVASEEYEPGGGWNYTDWLNYLGENNGCDGLELGKQICDSYYSKCKENGDDSMATLAVTDLSQIEALQTAFDNMAAEMTGVTGDITTFQSLAKAAVKAENYGGNTDDEGYTNMVDLGDLAIKTNEVLSEASSAVVSALSNAVKYSVHGSNRESANGLSVFYPLSTTEDECNDYASVCTSANYLKFIEAMTGWTAPDGATDGASVEDVTPVTQDEFEIKYDTYVDDDAMFNLDITSGLDSVLAVRFSLYYMDEESSEYLLLGLDDDIVADWDKGNIKDNFSGNWLTLDDNYCCPKLVSQEDTYNVYSIPIELNGNQTNLRVIYDFESEQYVILGAYNGIDSESGMSAKDIIKLKDGDEVTLLFDAINWDTGEETTYSMGSFTVDGDVSIDTTELFDGQYLYQYEIEDIFGNIIYTDSAVMECSNGEITVSEAQ